MLKELLISSGIKDFIEQNVKSQQMTQQKWYYNITIVLISQDFLGDWNKNISSSNGWKKLKLLGNVENLMICKVLKLKKESRM